MSKAARFFASFSAPRIYTERSAVPARPSDEGQLVAIILFSGIGLLLSLVAIILSMQGIWP